MNNMTGIKEEKDDSEESMSPKTKRVKKGKRKIQIIKPFASLRLNIEDS